MANTAKKIREKQSGYGKVHAKIGRHKYSLENWIGEKMLKAYEIRNNIEMMKQRLDMLNADMIDAVSDIMNDEDAGSCRIECAGIECRIVMRESILISDHEKLKAVLGDRFEDLVRIKVSYVPEPKLRRLALGSLDPMSDDIMECLEVKDAKATVTYKPME